MDNRNSQPGGFLERFRQSEMKETVETTEKTQCPYCSMQCTMWLREERTPHIRRIEAIPNREDPVVQGRMCIKGMGAHDHALDHPDRLKTPLLRKEGELTPVSWEEAMEWFQEKVKQTQERWGRDAVGVFGGGSLTNEEAYLLGKFARVALGTRYIDYNGRFCMSSAAAAANQAFGVDRGLTNPLADLALADCIILAGTNIAECQPTMIAYLRQAKERGASLIVIDPRETATARLADMHLVVRPGTDATLVNGMLKVILEEGFVDEGFVQAHTVGYEELREHLSGVSLMEVARRTGVSVSDIRRAARLYGKAAKGFVLTARGVEQHANGVMNVRNFINLVLLTGKIGYPGSGYGAVTGQGNGQGGREHGQKADQLPGYRRIDDPEHRRAVAAVWGVEESQLPGPGVSAYEMFEAMDQEEIRGLVILSSNPVVSVPNAHLAERALKKLDFLVSIDLFLSETAELADLVLPGSAYLEDEGTMTNLEGRVVLRKAIRPLPGNARLDWQIIGEMARVLGKEEHFAFESAKDIFEELRQASRGGLADYSGISYERIEKEDGVFWPCPSEEETGQERLFTDGRFFHSDGRARLIAVSDPELPEKTERDYPLVLTTGRVISHYLTGVQTRRSRSLNEKEPEPFLSVHPATADSLGLKDGEKARIISRRGEITLKVKRTEKIRKDVVFCPMHWGGEGAINRLTLPELDPYSRMPSFKACAVRVESVEPKKKVQKRKKVRSVPKRKLVVVGNGMAGVNVVEHVLKLDRDAYDITIFGKEPHPNYNRILLSSVLAGDTGLEDIVLNSWEWYRENEIQLHTGRAVTRIDTKEKRVYAEGGISTPYDELVLATGSDPFMLPLPGADKEGVIAFRDIKDCETMMETAKQYKKAAVIGGGLLGLEAARGLLNLGMEVQVIHIFDTLMERQLDREAARMLRMELEEQGMQFLMEKQTERILGGKRVTGLHFKDGSSIDADLVVMAVGIKPNVQLAKESGIEINRGVVVDDWMATGVPGIHAVGECAEHRGTVYGLVAPHREQGAVLAKRLCGLETEPYEGSVTATKLKVSGVDVFSAGEFNDGPETRAIRSQDEWKGIYKKVLFRGNRITGGVLFGDTSDSAFLLGCIREGREMTDEIHASLMGTATGGGGSAVREMADDDQVCDCNGISKGEILSAIRERDLTDVEGVKSCTKAGASCGGCKPLVASILEAELSNQSAG
ncbi:assimilatory nitrate reductase catalytic subunit NasC [Desmospora profundinema]|uniref:Assimilatory nitrate reductase catalytic subunit n=1 Tax=Desmospora profundinema TaxID=1571184 RepID=A0ABU1IPI3_9BACL|nr:nitrite reductase large subunit NirB [Desmospora profundinema]MDR6226308.1 assimilatory nitrate reductase catalytic subunit [Desmospora profundinema]